MILDIAEYQALYDTSLADEALQILLDAAEADILDYAGPPGEAVEWFAGGRRMVALARRADSVTSIVEVSPYDGSETTLAADDYLTDPTGLLLYRDRHGTNPRSTWWGRVVVTYSANDDEARRKVVQGQLVAMAERYTPGVAATTVGSWTEQYHQQAAAHADERDAILSQLASRGRMAVV